MHAFVDGEKKSGRNIDAVAEYPAPFNYVTVAEKKKRIAAKTIQI